MLSRNIHVVFSLCVAAALLGAGCGPLLGLDDYTQNPAGTGGAAGMGSGGEGGQAGQGGAAGECMSGETAACYDGPAGTQDKGVCKAGTKTCGADGQYGACTGQVVPSLEDCAVASDEDCSGSVADCTGSPVWSVGYGSTANSQIGFAASGMTDGSIVVAGIFTDTFVFGACGMVSTSGSSPNIFLAKLGTDGACQFVKEFGDTIGYDYGYDVALTKNDDIVLTGGFTSAGIDFGGGAFMSQGSNDVYVAKFNKMGGHVWSRRYGDSGDQLAYTVGLDANDNIFIAGDFGGTLDFGSGHSVTVASSGQTAGFVAKLDAAGTALYSQSFAVATNAGDYLMTTRGAVDTLGNATIVGRFKGILNVGGTTLTSAGIASDVFVIRYAPDGTLVYAKNFGATEEEWNPKVATAPDGSVYITGTTLGTSLNLTSFVVGKTVMGAGGGDVFLIKLNPDGSFADAKVFGNNMDQGASSITVDPLGHVVLGGAFAGQLDFGQGALNATLKTLFLAKFDATLKPLWSKEFFSDKPESAVFVGTDPLANILITGGYSGALQIEIANALPQQGGSDIFVAKLAP